MATLMATLRQLTQHCEFRETLDDMLRDRLVCGINDVRLQCCFLAKSTLTFEKALSVMLACELAQRNARHLQPPTAIGETVHAIGQGRHHSEEVRRQREECFQCGGKHNTENCNFRSTECFSCWRKGHLARMCHHCERSEMGRGMQEQEDWLAEESELQTAKDELPEYGLF